MSSTPCHSPILPCSDHVGVPFLLFFLFSWSLGFQRLHSMLSGIFGALTIKKRIKFGWDEAKRKMKGRPWRRRLTDNYRQFPFPNAFIFSLPSEIRTQMRFTSTPAHKWMSVTSLSKLLKTNPGLTRQTKPLCPRLYRWWIGKHDFGWTKKMFFYV